MTAASEPMIRHATVSDATLLAELGRNTFLEAFTDRIRKEDLIPYVDARFGLAQQASELADPHVIFFIAEVGGVPAGYAKLCESVPPDCILDPHPLEMERLYISQQWLGRGIANALTDACLVEASRRGYKTLWLDVWERNERARAFYRKYGFEEVGSRLYMVGTDAQTHLLMVRSLLG